VRIIYITKALSVNNYLVGKFMPYLMTPTKSVFIIKTDKKTNVSFK
jgi:hypothetical protein